MLVLASGSLTSVLARLLPPTAVLLVLLAAPASAEAQTITPNCDTPGGARDTCSHWYRASAVSLTWTVDPGGTKVAGCENDSFAAETVPRFRKCEWNWSGSTYTATIWIGIDRTPPRITGLQTTRPPDYGGWFNHPVSLTFRGSDAVSGVDGCTSTTYAGPGGAVAGSCTDSAGNTASGSLPIKYDATAPRAPAVTAQPRNHRVRVDWTAAAGALAEVTRSRAGRAAVVYRGAGDAFADTGLRNGERYRYTVALIDQAGNRAAGRASAVPTASPLFTPAPGARLGAPPLLSWRKVRRASYYNVQLFRGNRKVLSRWPEANELQLKRRWRFAGKRRRLAAGRYCYFVWPGYGPRTERDYGRLLGKRCFRLTT
jgi:hypothetical protein